MEWNARKKRVELNKTMGVALQAVIGAIKLLGMGEGIVQVDIQYHPGSKDYIHSPHVVCSGYTDIDIPFTFHVTEDDSAQPLGDLTSVDQSGRVTDHKGKSLVRWARRYTRGFRFEKLD